MELFRPNDKKSRMTAVFAFDKPEFCIRFMYGENKPSFYLYEVAMDEPSACPMCLVDILRDKELSQEQKQKIALEYWNPQQSWNWLEYLSKSMTVISEIQIQDHEIKSYAASSFYEEDQKQAKSIINLSP